MFGRLEKLLLKRDTILTPEEYFSAFAQVAEVRVLKRNWKIHPFMNATKVFQKSQQQFKISEMKFIRVLSGGRVECSEKYDADSHSHNFTKATKNFNLFRLDRIAESTKPHPITKEKLNDIRRLLLKAGIGDTHACADFYRNVEESM